MAIQKGQRLKDCAIETLVQALLEGPQTRDALMKRTGISSPNSFYSTCYRIGPVKSYKTRIAGKLVRLFWLDSRPQFRKDKTTDHLEEILEMRRQSVPYKQIARDLGLAVHAIESMQRAVQRAS